jgi:hypothetical protein
LYRERSVSRDAALAALRAGELSWQIVYTRPSLTSVRAAALAITPLPASAVIACASSVPKWSPAASHLEFAIYEKARPDKAASALAAALLALAQGPSPRRF